MWGELFVLEKMLLKLLVLKLVNFKPLESQSNFGNLQKTFDKSSN